MKRLFSSVFCLAFLLTSCSSAQKNTNQIQSVDDLTGKIIGVQLATISDTYVTDNIEDAVIERYSRVKDAVMALDDGKVDAIVIDIDPAKYYTKHYKHMTIVDESIYVDEYAIAINKSATELEKSINSALTELTQNGTIDSIKSRWLSDNYGSLTSAYTSPADADYPNGTLTIATTPDFPPYEMMDGDNVIGLDIDLMRAVGDIIGRQLVVETMDFDTLLTAVESGTCDVAVSAISVNDERRERVNFSSPYMTSNLVIVTRNN